MDLLYGELKKIDIKKNKVESVKKLDKIKYSKYDKACQNILYFMMNDGVFIQKFQNELGYFDEKKYRNVVNEIIYYYEIHKVMELSSFISFVSTKDYIYDDVMEIIKTCSISNFDMVTFEEFLKVAKEEMVKKEIEELKIKLANSMDANEELELAQKILDLKKGCVGNES